MLHNNNPLTYCIQTSLDFLPLSAQKGCLGGGRSVPAAPHSHGNGSNKYEKECFQGRTSQGLFDDLKEKKKHIPMLNTFPASSH